MSYEDEQDVKITVTQLSSRVGAVESALATIISKMDSMASNLNASQRTNWPVIIGISSLLFVVVAAASQIIDLKTQVAMAPLHAQSAISTTERTINRQGLEAAQKALGDEIGNRKAGFSALQQQLVENESQQRFHDSVRALQYQHLEGLIQMLYTKQRMPVPPPMTHQPQIGRDVNIPIPNN